MSIKDELVFDFAINIPRLVICGDMIIIDNVKRIAVFTNIHIIVHNGNCYTSIKGKRLVIKELGEERMIVKGELETVQFLQTL